MKDEGQELEPGGFPADLEWSENEWAESLNRLYEFANRECTKAIKWYYAKRGFNKRMGQVLRIGAILAAAISGVIPILVAIAEKHDANAPSPAWATVALTIAVLLMTLDRFGGYTSAWVRYIRAVQALSTLQGDFRVEWESLKLKAHAGQFDIVLSEQAIDQCREFVKAVNQTVSAETDQWAQEFQKVLIELEKKTIRKE